MSLPRAKRGFIKSGVKFSDFPKESLLAAIVDSSDDAIVSKDLNGTITSWNKGAERIFGYKASEIIGKPITTLIPPERIQEERQIISRLINGERVDHFETIRLRKDGKKIEVSLTISPIKSNAGLVVGASKIARDITEKKQAEQIIRRALNKAHETSKAKDQFLAALSHELRTPLMPASMSLSFIQNRIPFDEDIHRHLKIIERNLETETKLIDSLLDLTRITRRKMEIVPERMHLHPVLEQAIATCQSKLEEKDHQLKITLEASNDFIMGDPIRLEQVLWNVLENAIKFTKRKGKIKISTKNLKKCLCVIISDNGIGFEGESRTLFYPFQQRSPEYGGLGMGLALAKSFVEFHHGSIKLQSRGKGKGATVKICLPTLKSEEED